MIKKLSLYDFMSHEDTVVDFSKAETILVTGENGSGKSSMLEGIVYALYGSGRGNVTDLIRKDCDTMSVRLEIGDITIRRSRSRSAKSGICKIYRDGKVVSKGSEADQYIAEFLGVDKTTFMLTCFFGFGANDTLLNVTPASRSKTFQRLLGINVYEKFYAEASKILKQHESRVDVLSGKISAKEGSAGNVKDLGTSLFKLMESKVELCSKISNNQSELDQILHHIRKFETELESMKDWHGIGVLLDYTRKDLDQTDLEREKAEKYLKDAEKRIIDTIAMFNAETLDTYPMCPRISIQDEHWVAAQIKDQQSRYNELKYQVDILKSAIKTDPYDRTICPLCENEIDQQVVDHWKERLNTTEVALTTKLKEWNSSEKIREIIKACIKAEEIHVAQVGKVDALEADVKKLTEELRVLLEKYTTLRKSNEATESDLKKHKSKSQELNDLISDQKYELGSLNTEIDNTNKELARATQIDLELEGLSKNIAGEKDVIDQAMFLKQAFSSYGIPMDLIDKFAQDLSGRATTIYSMFVPGASIVIESDEGSQSKSKGMYIYVMHSGAHRQYHQLSEGQKVMVYLSVRLALTGILFGNIPPFIVLDEVSSHLSETSMDTLMKSIVDFVGNLYQQVILVSHTNVRDIFDMHLNVCLVDNVSEVVNEVS